MARQILGCHRPGNRRPGHSCVPGRWTRCGSPPARTKPAPSPSTRMLGALSADDRRRGETVLEAAIDQVLNQPRQSWSSPAVIIALHDTPTW